MGRATKFQKYTHSCYRMFSLAEYKTVDFLTVGMIQVCFVRTDAKKQMKTTERKTELYFLRIFHKNLFFTLLKNFFIKNAYIIFFFILID